jgi:hypothetical protein
MRSLPGTGCARASSSCDSYDAAKPRSASSLNNKFARRSNSSLAPYSSAATSADILPGHSVHLVGFEERPGQRQGSGRVLQHQFVLDLPEPGFEFATELTRLRVTQELSRPPPPRQRLAKSRRQRLGLHPQLQPHEPIVTAT